MRSLRMGQDFGAGKDAWLRARMAFLGLWIGDGRPQRAAPTILRRAGRYMGIRQEAGYGKNQKDASRQPKHGKKNSGVSALLSMTGGRATDGHRGLPLRDDIKAWV
jgi:hypothetical protein